MANRKSKRQLNIHVQIGALNVVLYPDRINSTAAADPPPSETPTGAPRAQANKLNLPARLSDYAFAFTPPINNNIGLPLETFIYGAISQGSKFNLIAPPSKSAQTFFPFSQNYDYNLNKFSIDQAIDYSFASISKLSSQDPIPIIPSRTVLTKAPVPKLSTYNIWVITNPDGSENFTDVKYYTSGNPKFSSVWPGGSISQVVDDNNQAAIRIDSLNSRTVTLRRMFSLKKDSLYEPDATLVYPAGYGLSPVKFNLDSNGKKIIDPSENCSWYTSFDISDITGSISDNNNFQGITIEWGDIDSPEISSLNTNNIVYYSLSLDTSAPPMLKYYNPVDKTYSHIDLRGPKISKGVKIQIFVWYVGNVMAIGFDSDPSSANVIGPIDPLNTTGSEFTTLYHKIPGGINNPKTDSCVSVTCSNVKADFKYSALAFKNFVNKKSDTDTEWYSDEANKFKMSMEHNMSVSKATHKILSKNPEIINNFFWGRGLLKSKSECFYNTQEYINKSKSIYFDASDTLDDNVKINESSQFWAADNRIFSPYANNFNDSSPWPIKLVINNPNFNPSSPDDAVAYSNMNLLIVFDNPVYGAAYHGITTSLLKIEKSPSEPQKVLRESSTDAAISLQNNSIPQAILLNTNQPSFNDSDRGLIVSPTFDFKWGNITDLIKSDTITVSHSIVDEAVGKSECSFSMDNLIFSNRGNNILNLLENNAFVITIRAGYNDDINRLPMFFQGVITNVETSRSPMGSKTTIRCTDWLNYILENSYSFSTFSLQGLRVRDRVDIAMRLAALSRYFEIIDSKGNFLPNTPLPLDAPGSDQALYTALNYRQGNATSKVAAQNLSETIDTDNPLIEVIKPSIAFVLSDNAIAIMYQNLRNDLIKNPDFDTKNIDSRPPYRKVVMENRFLPQKDSSDTTQTTIRFRDELKWIIEPQKIEFSTLPNLQTGIINIGPNPITNDYKSLAIEDLHGTIISPIQFTSSTEGLYEGVYIIAVGVGSVPLFHIRSSDSYYLGMGENVITQDVWQYMTASNRYINSGLVALNVLDFLDNLDVNNDTNQLLRQSDLLHRFDYGYVGFRKRFMDDQKQTYIQTKQDLIRRGDLWAQYVRKVPQSITFDVLVSKPLEHYNNFIIKWMDSHKSGVGTIAHSTFAEIFDEFTGFLYKTVNYSIDKSMNIIKASVAGAPVPRINPRDGTGTNPNLP